MTHIKRINEFANTPTYVMFRIEGDNEVVAVIDE